MRAKILDAYPILDGYQYLAEPVLVYWRPIPPTEQPISGQASTPLDVPVEEALGESWTDRHVPVFVGFGLPDGDYPL